MSVKISAPKLSTRTGDYRTRPKSRSTRPGERHCSARFDFRKGGADLLATGSGWTTKSVGIPATRFCTRTEGYRTRPKSRSTRPGEHHGARCSTNFDFQKGDADLHATGSSWTTNVSRDFCHNTLHTYGGLQDQDLCSAAFINNRN